MLFIGKSVLGVQLSSNLANTLLQSTIGDFDYSNLEEFFGTDFTTNHYHFLTSDNTWTGNLNGDYLENSLNIEYSGDFSSYDQTGLINWTSQGIYNGQQWSSNGIANFSGEIESGITVDINSSLTIGSNSSTLNGLFEVNVFEDINSQQVTQISLISGQQIINGETITLVLETDGSLPTPGSRCFAKGNPRTRTYQTTTQSFELDGSVRYISRLNKLECNLFRGAGKWKLSSVVINKGRIDVFSDDFPSPKNDFEVGIARTPESSSIISLIAFSILGTSSYLKHNSK